MRKNLLIVFIVILAFYNCSNTVSSESNTDVEDLSDSSSNIKINDIVITEDANAYKDTIVVDSNEYRDDGNLGDTTGSDLEIMDYAEDTMVGDLSEDVPDINQKDVETFDAYTDTLLDIEDITDNQSQSGIYKSNSDSYQKGFLTVKKVNIKKGDNGAQVDATVYVPQGYNEFAAVIFQHGFLLDNTYYSEILEHLSSHGFVVVAPQMYKADGIPIGKPKTPEEADLAIQFYNWLKNNLNNIISVNARMDILGLAGHSRGGKVVWTIMLKDSSWSKAILGIDPVDGTGGPLGGESRIADKPFNLNITSLIIGTGLGPEGQGLNPACAPEGDNHVQFYNASSSPAFHSVALEYGHLDMLNDTTPNCGMTCTACKSGPDRANMRKYTAAQMTAFFRYTLQQDSGVKGILTNPQTANIKVTMESK